MKLTSRTTLRRPNDLAIPRISIIDALSVLPAVANAAPLAQFDATAA
jgi:hypothetical protein